MPRCPTCLRVRDKLQEDRRRLEQARATASRRSAVSPIVVINGVLEHWHEMRVDARREMLRALIDRVVVTTGRPRARVEIVPRE